MTYMTMDDEIYWQVPHRMASLATNHRDGVAGTGGAPEDGWRPTPVAGELSGVRTTQFFLGDPDDDNCPAANVIDIPPGYGIGYHTHPCDVLMLVLKGSLHVPGRVLHPGDGMTAKAGEFYGPEIAGPDGCTRVEFFAQMRGFLEVTYLLKDVGPRVTHYLEEARPPFSQLDGMEEFWRMRTEVRAEIARRRETADS